MPLRDHFHPPVKRRASWEALHGGLPMVIVQQLRESLPAGYIASPTVHHGANIEVDVAAYEKFDPADYSSHSGGAATKAWLGPLDLQTETERAFDTYEVNVYDEERDQQLVAAIEIVSPANKDRPESRRLFGAKCANLVQAGVAVSIVDIVTVRQFNLYADMMELLGHPLTTPGSQSPLYAASCRMVELDPSPKVRFESWSRPLEIGQPLPSIPLWLAESLVVPVDLEQAYEQACHDLWLT